MQSLTGSGVLTNAATDRECVRVLANAVTDMEWSVDECSH